MKTNVLTDLIMYSFIVGGIFVMTKPGSQGPGFVTSLTHGYSGIVQASTGQKVS